jgi:pantoate--beta-alanine ligase
VAIEVIRRIDDMRRWSREVRSHGQRIGFVPTMGYFHEGHLSLIRLAGQAADRVVVSIFVNPIQFGPSEDLARSPRDRARDRQLAGESGAHLLFAPSVSEMYPEGFRTTLTVRRLSQVLCGAYRPGHFDGVATVVLKLLNIVRPAMIFLGEKDYQQAVIIRRMISDLNLGVNVLLAPTVREPDGLAMSSRNVYLADAERDAASVIYRSLCEARRLVEGGETRAHAITGEVRRILSEVKPVQIEYVSAVDPDNLEEVSSLDKPTLVAVAVRIGGCRLIDSMICVPKTRPASAPPAGGRE